MACASVFCRRAPAISRFGTLSAALVTSVLLITSACALKTPPDATAIQQESLPAVKMPPQWTATGAGPVADNWVATFRDDDLTAAVVEAIANNPDLRVGAARVETAMLYAKLAGAKLYPSVDLLARGGERRAVPEVGQPGLLQLTGRGGRRERVQRTGDQLADGLGVQRHG